MKILYITPNPADPLAFYRGSVPLASLRRHHNVDYYAAVNVDWSHIINCDLVFMQRPYREQDLSVMKMAKQWKIPVVVDFDDWLYELPQDNPAFHVYNGNKFHHQCAEMADKVLVATEDMASLYMDKYGISCEVVPNAYCTDTLSPRSLTDHSKIVLWRGSNSHDHDNMSVRMGWIELIKKHTDWQFCFINRPPWWLGFAPENVKVLQPYNVLEYMHVLHKIKPAIMTHPLTDCNFNRSKSMCSWIEASHAGAAFVGPAFREYQRDGITNYEAGNSESFFKAIDSLIMNPVSIIENAEKGQKAITSTLSLRRVNELRLKAFRSVYDC